MTRQEFWEKQLTKVKEHANTIGLNVRWWLNGCLLEKKSGELIKKFEYDNDLEFLRCMVDLISMVVKDGSMSKL